MSIARNLPILWLTIRQFRAGRSIRVVAFFAAISIILAGIFLLGSDSATGRSFLATTYLQLLAPTVVPLATLILATSAFGNEIGDRTLPYLTLKPISRARIVLEKYAGVVFVTALAFLLGLLVTWAMVSAHLTGSDWPLLYALLLAAVAGILAYGALFLMASLVVGRALMVGIIYIMIWESLLARFIPGVKLVSVRHFTQSTFVRVLDDPGVTLSNAMQLPSTVAVLGALVVVSLALASLRLRRMNLD